MRPSIHGRAEVAATAIIGDCCTLAYPREVRLAPGPTSQAPAEARPVVIGERCILFNQVIIYEGVEIGEGCIVEDRVRIGYDSRIGPRTRLAYGAFICDRVTIGADARVAGFVCDGTTIGARCTVMGSLVHEYAQPHLGWWEVDEEPPVIEPDSVIGYGSTVVGGVRIGPRSYVAAGAMVTRDVPPEHVVTGVNVQTPAARWRGRRLQELIRHWHANRPSDRS
jgi:acetyltransferase-like isoleucine patch superfamily enzyme